MPSLLIADSSQAFCAALTDALLESYRVCVCGTGKEALDFLTRNPTDLVILDLMLPELDGLSLLQRLDEMNIRPIILATTALAGDYVIEAAASLGVSYLMLKPCDIRAVVSRINDLYARGSKPCFSTSDSCSQVSELLISLGISTKHRGYAYLREAILSMAEDPMQSVTKELYPEMARQFGCSCAQVERSSRSAIQSAWSQGVGDWAKFFFPDKSGRVSRPSNAVFISRLAEQVRGLRK